MAHLIAKAKVGVVTIMDSGVKTVIRVVWLEESLTFGLLLAVSLEVK